MLRQKQRYVNDCGLASIATLVGREYDELWPKEWQGRIGEKGMYGEDIETSLSMAGLDGKYLAVHNSLGRGREQWEKDIRKSTINGLLWGRRALLQVPSLNFQGKSHLIVWHYDEVWDPSNLLTYTELGYGIFEWAWLITEKPKEEDESPNFE